MFQPRDLLGNDNSSNVDSIASATTSTFLTSLATNGAIAGIEFLAWILVRRLVRAVYEPRTYIPPHDEQARPLGANLIKPIWRIIMADEEEILRKNGVDPYVFVRFIRMLCTAFVPIWFLSWVILMPINRAGALATTSQGAQSGLDMFTFGSVVDKNRYWAHCILSWVFNGWLLWLVWREMGIWVVVRQRHLVSPKHSRLAQASTVLVTGIPKHYMDEGELTKLFSHLPGGVKRVWLSRDLKDMPSLWERRMSACSKLENAEVALLQKAHKFRADREKQIAKLEKKGKPIPEHLLGKANPVETGEPQSRADELVPRSMRPTMRLKAKHSPIGLGFLGIGQKVDTIDWCRQEIAETTRLLDAERETMAEDIASNNQDKKDTYRPLSSAFILFNQQIAAHMARQCLTYNQPYMMNNRYIEQAPPNVIWSSLGIRTQYERNVRMAISYGITGGMILFWAIPVTFIGSLSSVTGLTDTFHWLRWILGDSFGKKLLQGVISGILPPVLLALLMMLLPIIFRHLSAFQGTVSKTEVELDVMSRYFLFLVVHSFILITLSSGLIASLGTFANNTTAIATTLAQQLPKASTFFLTLIMTQFTGTMGNLLMPVTVLMYYVKVILGGGTPRKIFSSRYQMGTPSWGTDFPGFTIYAVIMIAYMVISPIINGVGSAFCLMSYLIYKYIYIWVDDQPPATDTGGLFFPKAVTHIFVGLYLQELCLCALFFLKSCLGQAIMTIILIVGTVAVQLMIKNAYGPLINSLPISLAHLSYGMPHSDGHRDSIGDGNAEEEGDEDEEDPTSHTTSSTPVEKPAVITSPPVSSPFKNPTEDAEANTWDEMHWDEVQEQWRLKEKWEHHRSSSSHYRSASTSHSAGGGKYVSSGKEDHELAELGKAQSSDSSSDFEGGAGAGDDDNAGYFARPGGPGVYTDDVDDGDDPNAFFHPATKDPQPIIWIPEDPFGLAAAEVAANADAGVESTTKNSYMDSEGKVFIRGPPPDGDSIQNLGSRVERGVIMV